MGSLFDQERHRAARAEAGLSVSEIVTILLMLHGSQCKYLKSFYKSFYNGVTGEGLRRYFPGMPCYERFVALQPSVLVPLPCFLLSRLGTKNRHLLHRLDRAGDVPQPPHRPAQNLRRPGGAWQDQHGLVLRLHCVKKRRKPHAVREMKGGLSGSPIRGRSQTAVSCCGKKAVVVNITVKRGGKTTSCGKERDERKRTCRRRIEKNFAVVKTANVKPLREESVGCLILDRRRPVYRGRDSPLGSCTELENLSGDVKRKGASATARGRKYRSTTQGRTVP